MIGVTLSGGLGNQMFQYAAAFALADRLGTDMRVSTSEYWNIQKYDQFELWRFQGLNLQPIPFGKAALFQVLRRKGLISAPKPTFGREGLGFDTGFFDCRDGTHLYGYFQSIKYFEACLGDIQQLFAMEAFAPPQGTSILQKLRQDVEVVSIHVRRGDYLKLPIFHINVSEYYRVAIEHFRDRNRIFLVMSDDIEWCRRSKLFRSDDIKFLSDLGIECHTAIEEMAIMSLCNHHIIANSTFSWWAAQLNRDSNKQVVMPRQWLVQHSARQCGLHVSGWTEL